MGAVDAQVTSKTHQTVGIVGGGQLALMLCEAAKELGITTIVLADHPDDPACSVADACLIGAATDFAALEQLSALVDVVTFDHEQVDLEQLRNLAARGVTLSPGLQTLEASTDKATMRETFQDAGFPLPSFVVVDQGAWMDDIQSTVLSFARSVGLPLIIKPAQGGYDGRGVFVEETEDRAIDRVVALSAFGRVLIEVALDLEAELAVMVARSADGSSVVYPPVVTTQVDGMCREVVVPAPMDEELLREAQLLAMDVAEVLQVVGVLAVELFVVDDVLAICEVAARPHNSGHWTIEGTSASQFENHLRAVTGLPLGEIEVAAPAVVMVNLVGNANGDDPVAFLGEEPVKTGVHLYGKTARPGRKLGHVTLLGSDVASVREQAWELTRRLHGALPPSDSLS